MTTTPATDAARAGRSSIFVGDKSLRGGTCSIDVPEAGRARRWGERSSSGAQKLVDSRSESSAATSAVTQA